MDLRKAFDTVSHDILLKKLRHYGVGGVVYNLLKSYLTERKQFVYINGSYSTTQTIQFGVPQGSNLGPILVSIYVNDMFNIFDFSPVLYADDTCLYVKASKEKDLESLMNRKVEIANRWMTANKLTINATKSSALLITPGAKTATQTPKIVCDGLPIAVNSNVKYLVLWIDENLKFDIHLKFVERKIACAVGMFNKLKCYFPKEILLQLYHALIYPHLLYAIPIWGSIYKSYLHKISILRNKAVKIVTQTKWNSSANFSCTNLKFLKLNKLHLYEVGKIMYNLYHKQHPYNLNQYFSKSNVRHSRPTRCSSSHMLTIPLMKTTKLQQSFLYQGVKTWNSIPHNIKNSSFSKFKSDSKQFFLTTFN